MIKLKACPKCHGDLYLERDQYGRYMSCLQCGYLTELPEISLSEQSRRTPAEAEQLAA
jgi:DNA-directed RNA polymerase subunit M/transcription elongation factor TFIIS